jgi:3-hydroxyisobutyrate dehydrogenase
MHYGYIGLGNLGAACAGCLLQGTASRVTVYDLNPNLASLWWPQARPLPTSAEEVAAAVDHVITCLPSPAVSERVLRNILPHMKKTASWVEMSTLGRDEVLKLAAVAAEAGHPHDGTARDGRGASGPSGQDHHARRRGQATFTTLHYKAMQAMGDKIFHMGPLGSSSIIKVITNMLAFIHLKATSEALMLAKRGGLDLGQAWHAIKLPLPATVSSMKPKAR